MRHILPFAAWLVVVSFQAALAASERDAAALIRAGDFGEAAQLYRQLVAQQPGSIALRLRLADALAKDRQWQAALDEYQRVLQISPQHIEALDGIGTVRRWQGHVDESKAAYQQARAVAPGQPAGALGLGAALTLDHDYAAARALYAEAEQQWPQDAGVRAAAYDFRRRNNPRIYVYYEDDLSFELRQAGVTTAYGREELGIEAQRETRPNSYTRDDQKLYYTHFLGFNHTIEASLRSSSYSYDLPPAAFSAIDTFQEYRLRYTYPVTPEQVVAVRYTYRPTQLISGPSFNSHKIEAELRSTWQPRLRTVLGTGWLRDLDSNALSTADLTDNSLLKAEIEIDASNRLTLGAKYITNPDLDSTVNSMTILQGSYTIDDDWSALARYRYDDYKTGAAQSAYYAGARYTPNSHLWSEFGYKYVERGAGSGNYPLVSLIWSF